MSETIPTKPTTNSWQGHSAPSVLTATLLTMMAVFLISGLSVETAVAVGSFAGFCAAAWNWFRLGRRRKALVHVLAGLVIYWLFLLAYALLALLLQRAFAQDSANILQEEMTIPGIGVYPAGTRVIQWPPQMDAMSFVVLTFFSLGVGGLIVFYLYRATAHDVPKAEALSDKAELAKLLPLLGIAAISSAGIILTSIFLAQLSKARFQNHVYCELLQPGMTPEEVATTLAEVGSSFQVLMAEDALLLPKDVPYFRDIDWGIYPYDLFGNAEVEARYELWLAVGYDKDKKLIWKGRYKGGVATTIECPWTFQQSVTAR